MQSAISPGSLTSSELRHAQDALRACVHCGFCNATCPTYPLLGTELEGPRGRIYLIKSVLEQQIAFTPRVVEHLDHCLSCLACETTCPSGVRYSRLIDPARALLEEQYRRPLVERLQRRLLAWLLPHPGRFRLALRLGALARPLAPLLPRPLRAPLSLVPRRLPPASRLCRPGVIPAQRAHPGPAPARPRMRVALLTGCAQSVLGPHINDATVRVLTRLGAEVVLPPAVGCCGALIYHMGDRPHSLPLMRANIAAWHGELERGGLDAVVINTSGCGTVVKDYGHIFADEPAWRERAERIAALAQDFSQVVQRLGMPAPARPLGIQVAYHDACSLQHAQRLKEGPRALLRQAGCQVLEVPEGHLCCGSAGTYNLLQPELARQLGRQKAQHIARVRAQAVVAGNIGCLEQIAHYAPLPVLHTAEVLDWALGGPRPAALHGRL